ncbi:formylglycine-generating enzyme family protein [Roseofilum casamattae]|nr:formylglycine-generating enzyme family protein [Roseofilum casamattae]
MVRLTIRKSRGVAQYYREDLGNNIGLEMVKIPPGAFLMGSPVDALERGNSESPQHKVSVGKFFCGRYPITQGQWKQVVKSTEAIKRELNPEPSIFTSRFKDNYDDYDRWSRPVEKVSWYEAQEFCARLRQKTGRDYRLPTEAQWEYACRADTTTPFHFGETITTDLANYCGQDREINGNYYGGSYGRGPKGKYRQETTPVGYFQVANSFGLCDMHGNVWEWCADDWDENHQGALDDGNVLRSRDRNATKVLRGGSWDDFPWNSHAALRLIVNPDSQNLCIGLRVVCIFPNSMNN